MVNALAGVIATFVTIPLLGWYFIYIISVKLTKDKRKSIKWASDYSTFLFIVAVYFIMLYTWNQSFIWLILIIILVTAIFFTILHWKTTSDINVGKLMKGIWRFNFLLFLFLYIVLSIVGLFFSIVR
ncbi:DUF3397 domain-containing protein [Alkalihalobacterium bogoriense]|uniref:DUF3397 domain-containing protein n=1 Tax=Alkalihalobacterium bogoriense TaxID=246272 RepID=UPI00047B1406|nr:DUF3397 domain-containing protein [Alkalihalobacterium bogoriense]